MKELFTEYLPLFTAICRRYAENDSDAKDLVQEGFIKIFSSIHAFEWKGQGSFSGWMKRIIINNAIDYCKKRQKHAFYSIEELGQHIERDEEPDEEEFFQLTSKTLAEMGFIQQDLIPILQQVPEPFRTVFNLYVIEGKKHKEIADILNIPEKTSTTRLVRARKIVKQELEKKFSGHLVTK